MEPEGETMTGTPVQLGCSYNLGDSAWNLLSRGS